MIGPYINGSAVLTGGLAGYLLSRIVPGRLEEGLPKVFSLVAITLGITMVVKVQNLSAVVLALIFGVAAGELLYLERQVNKAAGMLQKSVARVLPHKSSLSDQEFSREFTTLIVLFCVSSLGIIGSITEGVTGDYQFLLIKSILDFFTALIFALSLGPAVAFISLPQFIIQTTLFLLAKLIIPYMDETAYADFSACGGIIMLAVGFRMAKIKDYPVVNFLPALLLVIPFSHLWRLFFP